MPIAGKIKEQPSPVRNAPANATAGWARTTTAPVQQPRPTSMRRRSGCRRSGRVGARTGCGRARTHHRNRSDRSRHEGNLAAEQRRHEGADRGEASSLGADDETQLPNLSDDAHEGSLPPRMGCHGRDRHRHRRSDQRSERTGAHDARKPHPIEQGQTDRTPIANAPYKPIPVSVGTFPVRPAPMMPKHQAMSLTTVGP